MSDTRITTRRPSAAGSTGGTTDNFIQKLRENAPNSTQLIGIAALVISGVILLTLTGLTASATILGIIFSAPLIIMSSPVWIPVALMLSITAAGTLSLIGFGLGSVAVLGWIYRYFKGFHPPGSDRFDYARSRIADTASHVKDYAIEYGGYLQSKVKDAAPGA